MNLSRIKYLRNELEAEQINLVELLEIEEAFMDLVKSGEYVPGEPVENAMASDMLNVLEYFVPTVEKTIYSWVKENFGESEALEPSWDIGSLAYEINCIPVDFGAEESSVGMLLDGYL